LLQRLLGFGWRHLQCSWFAAGVKMIEVYQEDEDEAEQENVDEEEVEN
jgi:hypothetical protein